MFNVFFHARLFSDKSILSSSSYSKISSQVHDYLIRNSLIEVANEFNERMGLFEENDGTKLEDIYIHYLNHCNSPNRRNPKVSYFDVKVVMPRISFEKYDYRYFIGPIRYGSNACILHIRNYKEQTVLWLQLFDSRKEAKNSLTLFKLMIQSLENGVTKDQSRVLMMRRMTFMIQKKVW